MRRSRSRHGHLFLERFRWITESLISFLFIRPIFSPGIEYTDDRQIIRFKLLLSFNYYLWLFLGLLIPVLPIILYCTQFDNFTFYKILNKSYTLYSLVFVSFFIPLTFYYWLVNSTKTQFNDGDWKGYDHRHYFFVVVGLVCFLSLLNLLVLYGNPILGGIYSSHFKASTHGKNIQYGLSQINIYVTVSIIAIMLLIYYLHRFRPLSYDTYKNSSIENTFYCNTTLRNLLILSSGLKKAFFSYIPTRCFRDYDDYNQALERLCLYLIFVKDSEENDDATLHFFPVLVLFAPIWMPFLLLIFSASLNLYYGYVADESYKLLVWIASLSWGIYSFIYYHWVTNVYLEPIFNRRYQHIEKMKIDDFNFRQLGGASNNIFSGIVSAISQFLLLTAVGMLMTFFQYVAIDN